jgi:tetratricopeptide (TPR) repeat protein
MRSFRLIPLSIATAGLLLLAACEDDADKAERFFQSGVELAAQGDPERALLELRNVLQVDNFHREARTLFAELSLELGRPQEAYSQYLRLIEQYPDEVEGRVALAELALVGSNWDEVARHTAAALELAPGLAQVQALDLAVQYRQAVLDGNGTAQDVLAGQATDLLTQIRQDLEEGDNYGLVRIVLSHLSRSDRPDDALPVLEAALARTPAAEDLNMMKVQLLERMGDIAGSGDQLRRMLELFPENFEIQQAMINWYLIQDDVAGAEAYLRDRAGADDGPTDGHLSVIQLLDARVGATAARAEIERLIQANGDTTEGRYYASMLALRDFDAGQTTAAIDDLRALIEAEDNAERDMQMQILLARMLTATGEAAQADALVAAVLDEDASNVAALKLQANRLIDTDRSGAAIVALRRALDQNPQDSETLTIMARAHQRDGDLELAGERLALAVEVSGSGAAEALRYAQFLVSQNQPQIAATVLEDARRANPRDPQILTLLGSVALREGAWQQAQGIVEALRALQTEDAARTATELQAAILQGQNRVDDSLSVLEAQLAGSENASDLERIRTTMLIVQTQIRAGKAQAARTYLDTAMAELPASPDLQVLDATVSALMGDMVQAETGYRALIAQYPQSFLPVRLLINVLNSTGEETQAREALAQALERMPENTEALLIRASYLERDGDIDGAIATYEQIYAQDSNNVVIANNLASLISAFRDDEASLSRAATIARRLRGTEVPAFQDTYGWIAFRRGNIDEALEYLEPASERLPGDALVQYHLGMTYTAMGRTEDARRQLTRALELSEGRNLPQQMQTARETLETLETAPTE